MIPLSTEKLGFDDSLNSLACSPRCFFALCISRATTFCSDQCENKFCKKVGQTLVPTTQRALKEHPESGPAWESHAGSDLSNPLLSFKLATHSKHNGLTQHQVDCFLSSPANSNLLPNESWFSSERSHSCMTSMHQHLCTLDQVKIMMVLTSRMLNNTLLDIGSPW